MDPHVCLRLRCLHVFRVAVCCRCCYPWWAWLWRLGVGAVWGWGSFGLGIGVGAWCGCDALAYTVGGGLLDEAGVSYWGAGVSDLGGGCSGTGGLLLGEEVVVESTEHYDVVDCDGASWFPLVCLVGFELCRGGAASA